MPEQTNQHARQGLAAMTSETISSTAPAAPVYNPSEKQKGASKTSRIPIKIIPIEQVERLKSRTGSVSRPPRHRPVL